MTSVLRWPQAGQVSVDSRMIAAMLISLRRRIGYNVRYTSFLCPILTTYTINSSFSIPYTIR
jgi:hypothetical protein